MNLRKAYEVFVVWSFFQVKWVHSIAGLPRLTIALVETSEEWVLVGSTTNFVRRSRVHVYIYDVRLFTLLLFQNIF